VRHLARRGHFAEAHLVRDLARLRVALGIVLARLQPRQEPERIPGHLGGREERLEAGDERVPAEGACVPGDAGGDDRLASVMDLEGLEIRHGLCERLVEHLVARLEARAAFRPLGVGATVLEGADLEGFARGARRVVHAGEHAEGDLA
jgi:hypothetical protein